MSDKLISFPVFVEDSGETLILQLSSPDAERANTDINYLKSLINEIYNKRSQTLVNQLNEQTSTDQNTNNIDMLTAGSSCTDKSYTSSLEESDIEDSKDIVNEKSLFVWPSKCIYLLLEKYEEREKEFTGGIKRHNTIWATIANEIRTINIEYTVSGSQCQSKLNSLKKTYKKILDHNSVSGNDRKTWPYFERMHKMFGKTGWANPKAIASEAGPCEQATTSDSSLTYDDNKRKSKKRKVANVLNDLMSDIKEQKALREEKRKAKETWFQDLKEQRERQHQEKIVIMQKLLEAINKKYYN